MRNAKFTIWKSSTGRLMPRSVMPRNTMPSLWSTILRRPRRVRFPGTFANVIRDAFLEDEAHHDRDDEGVNRDCFGEGDTQDHVGLDGRLGLRVAAERLHGLANEVADGKTRAKTADADGKRGADKPQCFV